MRRSACALLTALLVLIIVTPAFPDADVDNDGDFDSDDVSAFIGAWLARHHFDAGWDPRADLNGDGALDWRDAAILTEALLTGPGPIPPVTLADYFVTTAGSRYIWRNSDPDRNYLITHGTIAAPPANLGAEAGDLWLGAQEPFSYLEELPLSNWYLWALGWSMPAADRIALRSVFCTVFGPLPAVYYLDPPNGVTLPRQLSSNQPFVRDIILRTAGGNNLSATLRILLRDRDVRVVCPADEFTDCIDLEFSLTVQGAQIVLRLWLARGVGVVRWATQTGSQWATYSLERAVVSGHQYGTSRTIQVAQDIPCAVGNIYVWQDDQEHKFGSSVLGTLPKGGRTCYNVVPFTVRMTEANTVFWLADGGYWTGLWGWHDSGHDYLLRPAGFTWPSELTVGQPVIQRGTVERDGTPNQGSWAGLVELVATNVSFGGVSGCHVAAWVVCKDGITEGFMPGINAGYVFIKPGLGPVGVVSPSSLVGAQHLYTLIYGETAAQTFGSRPKFGYIAALRLLPGERRLFSEVGAVTKVERALRSTLLGGEDLLEIATTSDWCMSLFWDISRTPRRFMGFMPRPDGAEFPRPLKLVPPMDAPSQLSIGQLYYHTAQLRRADDDQPAGNVQIWLMYVGSGDAGVSQCPGYQNAAKVELLYVITDTLNQVTTHFVTQWFTPLHGKIREDRRTRTPDNSSFSRYYRLAAAKGPSGEFNWPFQPSSPADYMPLASGNEWIYGSATLGYVQLTADAVSDVPDIGLVLPLTRRPYSGGSREVFLYRSPLPPVSIVGYLPTWSIIAGGLETPLTFPDQWEVADVVRTRCDCVFNAAGGEVRVPAYIVVIPYNTLDNYDTPAGTFNDIVVVRRFVGFDFTPTGHDPEWTTSTIYYARGVGPVAIWETRSAGGTQGLPGSLVYAQVGSHTYGTRP